MLYRGASWATEGNRDIDGGESLTESGLFCLQQIVHVTEFGRLKWLSQVEGIFSCQLASLTAEFDCKYLPPLQ